MGTVTDGVSNGVAVWPNPSAGRVHVEVSTIASEAVAEVSVYDVLGRRVASLHSGPLRAGTHPLALEAGELAPGLYVVRVSVTPADGVPWGETRRVTVAR